MFAVSVGSMSHDTPPEQPVLPVRGQRFRPSVLPDGSMRVCVLRPVDLQAQGYAELLQRVPWQQFWTLTFRLSKSGRNGGMHEEAADKAFRFFVSCVNREIYGPKGPPPLARRDHGGPAVASGTAMDGCTSTPSPQQLPMTFPAHVPLRLARVVVSRIWSKSARSSAQPVGYHRLRLQVRLQGWSGRLLPQFRSLATAAYRLHQEARAGRDVPLENPCRGSP